MSRQKIIAGNWKMNKTFEEAEELVKDIQKIMKKSYKKAHDTQAEMVIAPPFPYIERCVQLVNRKRIKVAAQNCASEEGGAFTGEVSAAMIRSLGADFVIIGHSERRTYFQETNELLAKKVNMALKYELTPIFCCGEVLSERKSGKHLDVIKKQLNEGLFHLDTKAFKKVVIAYEPVWAIGTGITASPDQAQEIHAFIRCKIAEKYKKEIADITSILYGGSCNAGNAKELFSCADVDGGLIGGASLKAEEFMKIVYSME